LNISYPQEHGPEGQIKVKAKLITETAIKNEYYFIINYSNNSMKIKNVY